MLTGETDLIRHFLLVTGAPKLDMGVMAMSRPLALWMKIHV